jgi:hypothetical protein
VDTNTEWRLAVGSADQIERWAERVLSETTLNETLAD